MVPGSTITAPAAAPPGNAPEVGSEELSEAVGSEELSKTSVGLEGLPESDDAGNAPESENPEYSPEGDDPEESPWPAVEAPVPDDDEVDGVVPIAGPGASAVPGA